MKGSVSKPHNLLIQHCLIMLHSLQICGSSVFKSWNGGQNSYRSAANAAYLHVMHECYQGPIPDAVHQCCNTLNLMIPSRSGLIDTEYKCIVYTYLTKEENKKTQCDELKTNWKRVEQPVQKQWKAIGLDAVVKVK